VDFSSGNSVGFRLGPQPLYALPGCLAGGFRTLYYYASHYNYLKVLKKVRNKGYRLERMLIVDDTPSKARRNYGNVIYPKEYLGDSGDNELLLLFKYLMKIKDVENVRTIEKRNWKSIVRPD
jgi:hypothetical protein